MPFITGPVLVFASAAPALMTKVAAVGTPASLMKLGSGSALVGKGVSASSFVAKSTAGGKVASSKGILSATKSATSGIENAANKTTESISHNWHNLEKGTSKVLHLPHKGSESHVVENSLKSFFGIGASAIGCTTSNLSGVLLQRKSEDEMRKKEENANRRFSACGSSSAMIVGRTVKMSNLEERCKSYEGFLCEGWEESTTEGTFSQNELDESISECAIECADNESAFDNRN